MEPIQGLGKETRGIGNQRIILDHTDQNIVEMGQNTQKGPGDVRKLASTQSILKENRSPTTGQKTQTSDD